MSAFLFQIILFSIVQEHANGIIFQEEKIYTVSDVSIKPEPVKGLASFQNRWSKKVAYPEKAANENIQGMVFIEFVVNADGTIVDAAVRSGLGHGCDEAALQGFVDASKEPWKPGVKNNQPVRVKMVLPFSYRIIKM